MYDQTDVSNLYNAFSTPYFKTVDFEEMDYQKEDLTWAIGGASNSISFTRDYWFARNYSVNPGGESIEKIVKICEFFSKLPDCPFQGLVEKCLKKYGPIFENQFGPSWPHLTGKRGWGVGCVEIVKNQPIPLSLSF